MSKGKLGAKADQAKGAIKEGVGKVTGNEEMELKGKAERKKGEAKEVAHDTKEKVAGKINEAIDKSEGKDKE